MPVFINNKFSHDTYDGRRARLQMLSANIAVQGPIIGLSAPLTTWASGTSAAFAALATGQVLEAAEAIDATAAFNAAFEAARSKL